MSTTSGPVGEWRSWSPARRTVVAAAAVVQLGLLAAALQDVLRRPAAELTAPKPVWTAVCFVNFVGPLSYFAFGRRAPARGLRRGSPHARP